jgi:hypothetical protein
VLLCLRVFSDSHNEREQHQRRVGGRQERVEVASLFEDAFLLFRSSYYTNESARSNSGSLSPSQYPHFRPSSSRTSFLLPDILISIIEEPVDTGAERRRSSCRAFLYTGCLAWVDSAPTARHRRLFLEPVREDEENGEG